MQFGSFDNLHRHQPQEISCRPPGAVRSFSHWVSKLFRNPLAIVLLVWGFLFLVLGVTLVYARGAGHAVNQQHGAVSTRAATDHKVSNKKTEAVEIFCVGEDVVIPPQAAAVKASPRRRTVALQRRARRQRAYGE